MFSTTRPDLTCATSRKASQWMLLLHLSIRCRILWFWYSPWWTNRECIVVQYLTISKASAGIWPHPKRAVTLVRQAEAVKAEQRLLSGSCEAGPEVWLKGGNNRPGQQWLGEMGKYVHKDQCAVSLDVNSTAISLHNGTGAPVSVIPESYWDQLCHIQTAPSGVLLHGRSWQQGNSQQNLH